MYKLDYRKIKLPTSAGSQKKYGNSKRTFTSASLTTLKPLCGSQQTVEVMGIPDHFTYLLTNVYAGQEATVKTGHEYWTGSKLTKEYIMDVYCHPAYLTYMKNTSYKMLGRKKHKLEPRLSGEISKPQICPRYHFNGRK